MYMPELRGLRHSLGFQEDSFVSDILERLKGEGST